MGFQHSHQMEHKIRGMQAAFDSPNTPAHLKPHLEKKLKETTPMANWMAGAVKPSHKGMFAAKAKRAGVSTAAYAAKESSAPGALGKEARLAQTFAKFRPKKKKKVSSGPDAFKGR